MIRFYRNGNGNWSVVISRNDVKFLDKAKKSEPPKEGSIHFLHINLLFYSSLQYTVYTLVQLIIKLKIGKVYFHPLVS